MEPSTLLYRQIHPSNIVEGRPNSANFRPSSKDKGLLSVSNGDMWTPEQCYDHYTNELALKSECVFGVLVSEFNEQDLEAKHDKVPFPQHVSVNYSKKNRREIEKASTNLKVLAIQRGQLHPAEQGL